MSLYVLPCFKQNRYKPDNWGLVPVVADVPVLCSVTIEPVNINSKILFDDKFLSSLFIIYTTLILFNVLA